MTNRESLLTTSIKYALLFVLIFVVAIGCSPTESGTHSHDEGDSHSDSDHNDEDHDEHSHDDEKHGDEDHDDHGEEGHREFGAHEHGAAGMTVAWVGNEIAVDLSSPAFNLIGFEYEPASDEEIALAEATVKELKEAAFLQFTAAADCAVVSAEVTTSFSEDKHEHDDEDHDEHGDEETHADIDAEYVIECQQADKLEGIDLSQLFSAYPNLEALSVEWVSETQQSAETLTASETALSFE